MTIKFSFEYVYNYIKEKGYELLSTEYKTSKDKLQIKCKDCDKVYEQTFIRFKTGM